VSATSELQHLFRAMKAPAAAQALPKLAERGGVEEWSHERFAQALLSTETNARDAHGGEARIRTARFPARKTLEEFDFTFQHSITKQVIEHLAQLDFLHARENVVLPPSLWGWLGVFHCYKFLFTVALGLDLSSDLEPAFSFAFQFARP
jgi:DNA replication protein DnaC